MGTHNIYNLRDGDELVLNLGEDGRSIHFLQDGTLSVWDREYNNIRFPLPEWLSEGIRDLIISHGEERIDD